MIWEVNMIERQDLFTLPPLGNFGVIPVRELPQGIKIGTVLDFTFLGDLVCRGSVVAIESGRSDLRKTGSERKYKIHWMPISEIVLKPIELEDIFKVSATRCLKKCKRRSTVYLTQKLQTHVVRYRKCPSCGSKWTTVEIFQGQLVAERKSR